MKRFPLPPEIKRNFWLLQFKDHLNSVAILLGILIAPDFPFSERTETGNLPLTFISSCYSVV